MGVFVFNKIPGNIPLGQKGVGRDYFPFNSDGLEQWGGGFNFVGAFYLLFGYGDGSYFFWV